MRNDKHLAIKLRKQGKSYNKISRELDIPKSTISDWLSDIKWSEKIKNRLVEKTSHKAGNKLRIFNKKRWEKWREAARQSAREQFTQLKNNPLFIAGLMLYWSEGDSKIENCQIRLSNTTPGLIRIFFLFLKEICRQPSQRIKCSLILYPDLNEKECKSFWSKISGISINQFNKSQTIKGKHPTKKLKYGICVVHLTSRELKEKIFVWINLFSQQF